MNAAMPLPLDVRLMNVTASLLISALVLTCLGLGLWWVLRQPFFAITQISVRGDTQHHTAASLSAGVATRLQGNFFTLDLDQARVAFEAVPWVRRAQVRREFPDRLEVVLQEHEPVARWGSAGDEGELRLLNRQGEVFEVGEAEEEGLSLPLLAGPDGQAGEVLARWRALQPLAQRLGSPIERLELQLRGQWHMELASGMRIELGQGSAAELSQRLQQLADSAAEVAARHGRTLADIEAADLRHVDGFALRLRGVSTGQPAGPGAGKPLNR